MQSVPPMLEGIKIDNRWVVLYSKYDIGCALERHRSSDCLGYDTGQRLQDRQRRGAVFAEIAVRMIQDIRSKVGARIGIDTATTNRLCAPRHQDRLRAFHF